MARLAGFLAPVFVLMVSSVCFAEMVDNPEFTQWSKFKVDTSVTRTMSMGAAQAGMTQTQTTKMTAASADSVTLETTMTMNMNGRAMSMPASTRVVPAKMDNTKPAMPDMGGNPAARPDFKVDAKSATETVELAGKKYTCHVVSTTVHSQMGDVASKIWVSDDVPGSLVKMECHDKDGNLMMKSETTDVQIK